MSIYPVRLWHFYDRPADLNLRSTIRYFAKKSECTLCGKKGLKPTKCWGFHSVPHGYGWDVAWCNEKCYEKGLKR